MSKIRMLALSFLIVGTVLLGSCAKPEAVSGATAWDNGQKETVAVEALTVSLGSLTDEINASGVVAGVREAFVVSETQGLVTAVSFSLGDRVAEGKELLRVDDRIAALNLSRFKEQYEAAKLELDATERLSAAGRSSPADMTKARGNYSGAKAQYETSLKAFNDTRLRAPVAGVVSSSEEVATVGASITPGARVARIVDTSSFKVTVGLGEREIGLIEVGAKVRVYVPAALGQDYVDGQVSAVAAGSNPATGSFPVVISFRNGFAGRVKSGMSANVTIQARAMAPSVVIPTAALFRRGIKYAVFVDDAGRTDLRELSLGRRSGVQVEVLSGLREGELLVISALTRLTANDPVASTTVGDSVRWE